MYTFDNKTVLVTGATGLIGSHIVDALMTLKNVKVIALSKTEKKLKQGFANYISNPNFSFIAQDISYPLELDDVDVDYIFHAAGPMEGKIIANCPVDVITPNLIGTQNCLEFLKNQKESSKIDGRFVMFSSVTVYGNMTDHDIIVNEGDTKISDILEAGNASYSQSKRMAEVIVQAYRKQYGVNAVIARLSTVYGNTRFKPDTAFFEFLHKSIIGDNIYMNISNAARRDNIYIDDAVEGILTVCLRGEDGQAYNISSNGEMENFAAVDEIAAIMADVANKKFGRKPEERIDVFYKNGKSNDRNAGIILDNKKLKSLGWTLKNSIVEGIRKTIEEAVDNG